MDENLTIVPEQNSTFIVTPIEGGDWKIEHFEGQHPALDGLRMPFATENIQKTDPAIFETGGSNE